MYEDKKGSYGNGISETLFIRLENMGLSDWNDFMPILHKEIEMTDFTLATAIISLIVLGFTKMPFSILIYAMLAVNVNTWEAWTTITFLTMVAQFIYVYRTIVDG